jgi:hypothetical protein
MLHRATDVTSKKTVTACGGHCCTERSIAVLFSELKDFSKQLQFLGV